MRSIAFALMLGVLLAAPTWAASIGLYSDPDCSSCNASIPAGSTVRIYIHAQVESLQPDHPNGAEFRVVGLPAGWTAQVTPNPAANIALGNPFGSGTNIGFPTGQPGVCVNLFAVDITATTALTDVVLRVTQHANPSNPLFQCPLLVMDWLPFTKICVGGGTMFVNSSQDCTVASTPSTWSHLKRLYQ